MPRTRCAAPCRWSRVAPCTGRLVASRGGSGDALPRSVRHPAPRPPGRAGRNARSDEPSPGRIIGGPERRPFLRTVREPGGSGDHAEPRRPDDLPFLRASCLPALLGSLGRLVPCLRRLDGRRAARPLPSDHAEARRRRGCVAAGLPSLRQACPGPPAVACPPSRPSALRSSSRPRRSRSWSGAPPADRRRRRRDRDARARRHRARRSGVFGRRGLRLVRHAFAGRRLRPDRPARPDRRAGTGRRDAEGRAKPGWPAIHARPDGRAENRTDPAADAAAHARADTSVHARSHAVCRDGPESHRPAPWRRAPPVDRGRLQRRRHRTRRARELRDREPGPDAGRPLPVRCHGHGRTMTAGGGFRPSPRAGSVPR